MNKRPYLLNFSLLVGACSLAASASAQDQTVNGNLFVNNSLDVNGNTASFGVNGANPGYSLIYTNGTPATVDFSATAPGVNWIWSQATNQPQLKLGNTNTLSLYAPGSALAAITLNPAGTSTFSQGLTVTGTLTASGGLASPNGIVTGGATGLSLQAGGTGNQNITLVPTGTGVTTTASPVTVTNATASTSTSTGALVVTGGVGVNGTLTAGNVTTGGTVNAGTLRVANVATSLTNLGLGTTNIANFGAINAADPSFFYPAPVAKVSHTATTGPFLSVPQVVTVAGNFAYVGSSTSTSFQILDITNPLLPVKRGSLVGTGVAPSANLAYPRGIAISGNYAYVTSQTNNALQVINITNPDAPVAAGSLLNGAGGAVLSAPYGIAVSGSYAYIASSSSNALEIVNIANPAAPVHAGKLTDATKLLGARAVAVAGSYAYVVSNTGNTLTVINVSNPAAPTLAATLAHNAAGPLLAGPTAIAISGNYAYVTSGRSNALQIIDISNPLVPVAKGALVTGTAGAQLTTPSAVTVVGTTAFVTASGTTKALQIVDVSNPLAPTPKGQLLDGSGGAALNGPTGIAVAGNYAYVAASSSNALQVLSIASGGGFQIKNTTVLTTDAANNLLLGSGLPTAKVAIGTTNATSRLTVAGTDTTAANSVVNFTDSANQSLLFVRNDGNVGIGTSTPTAKLDVAGDAKVSGTLTVGGQSVVTANQLANYATTAQVASYATPTALYNNSGNAISSVDTDGKVNFASGLTAGSDASASGEAATAIGAYTKASGTYSTAIGGGTYASGAGATALGGHTTASGAYSTSIGGFTTASGSYSTAMGSETTASGKYSTAMGSETTASGKYSTAMGSETTASGSYSTAMGIGTTANAYGSLVVGRFNVSRSENSPSTWVATDDLFIIGNGNHSYYDEDFNYVEGNSNAFVVKKNGETYIQGNVGIGNTTPTEKLDVIGNAKISGSLTVAGQSVVTANQLANSAYAKPTALYNNSGNAISSVDTDGKVNFASGLAAGSRASASGMGATAIGSYTTASGYDSTAMGSGTTASGTYSIAMGTSTTASGSFSAAMGTSTTASGDFSTAMGIGTTANAYGSLVVGRFNVSRSENSPSTWVATDDLFVIGNGHRYYDADLNYVEGNSNAFVVKKNGETYIQGNVGIGNTTPNEKLDVIGNAKISGSLTVAGQSVVTASTLTTVLAPYSKLADVATQLSAYQSATGSGAGLTALNASALTTGTLPSARIAAASLPWTTLKGKPTTVAGYGITDAMSTTGSGAGLTALNATQLTSGTLPIARIAAASVTNDKLTTNPLARANHTGTQAWSTLTATPTTVLGYGITDAVLKNASGDVTVAGAATVTGATILKGATTLAGAVTVTAPVTVKTTLRLAPSGDLGMGTFTTGVNPAN